ncbi:TGS domain-containing protein [Candidatus Woesearchaeota archaeon]|nr:TGS domain-containing protein [Candidatus Woesearchaeota archaeon]
MPINAGYEYGIAESKYNKAKTPQEKLKALEEMLRTAPSHKGSERLRSSIKQKISKIKEQIESQSKKRGGHSFTIKKEGAAQIDLVGTTMSGKSTFLNKITNANAKTSNFPFTTKKPEIGTMDYHGIKIQIIEVPAITKDFIMQEKGGIYLGLIKQADLLVIFGKDKEEIKLVLEELKYNNVKVPYIVYDNANDMVEKIWNKLGLIKVSTKQPGKKADYPPIAFKKGVSVRDLAERIHKDFVKKFRFARIWGKKVKFPGQSVGLNYELNDNDIVEVHAK